MTDEELQAIKERAKKATPGPWFNNKWHVATSGDVTGGYPADNKSICETNDGEYIENGNGVNDAAFIAKAREDVPALVAELEWYKKAQEAWWQREKLLQKEIIRLQDIEVNEYYRLRIGLETIAHHNIHTTTQTEIKDYAREVLQINPRNAEEEALIKKIMANLKSLEGESNE